MQFRKANELSDLVSVQEKLAKFNLGALLKKFMIGLAFRIHKPCKTPLLLLPSEAYDLLRYSLHTAPLLRSGASSNKHGRTVAL